MVFENLTLFELHMEGARIGPEFGGDEDEEAEDNAVESEDESGGRRLGPVFGFLLLAVGVALAVRRFRGRGETETEAEADEDGERVTIEAATEQ